MRRGAWLELRRTRSAGRHRPPLAAAHKRTVSPALFDRQASLCRVQERRRDGLQPPGRLPAAAGPVGPVRSLGVVTLAGPLVLLTNDDGIDSPGLRALATALRSRADLVVAAPSRDWSGSGTSVGTFESVRGGRRARAAYIAGVPAWTVDGPPAAAVAAAMLGSFDRRPELVVSGINAGMNSGRAMLHSGTVGAALTAGTFGARGCAISLARGDPWQWETAAAIGAAVTEWMLSDRHAPRVLNVNVPSVPLPLVHGARWARPDDFGAVSVAAMGAGGLSAQVVMSATSEPTPGSDTALCLDDWVTLTPLDVVSASPFPDVPADDVISIPRT